MEEKSFVNFKHGFFFFKSLRTIQEIGKASHAGPFAIAVLAATLFSFK
jgi:hypothetical protein